MAVENLAASPQQLNVYKTAQSEDPICFQIIQYCQQSWPPKHQIPSQLRPYWTVREALTITDGLLLYNQHMVVPAALKLETLQKLHTGHQGIQCCRLRAQSSVWWLKISSQIQALLSNMFTTPCAPQKTNVVLRNIPTAKVGSDLFEQKGVHYLLVVDYFSHFIEISKMSSTTSANIISALKTTFSRYGILSFFVSDNGLQYALKEFKEFCHSYDFHHITSSPYYAQGNALAECMVKTVKGLLSHSDDPYLAMLIDRTTPLPWCGYSPSELLMGRKMKTDIPILSKKLMLELLD